MIAHMTLIALDGSGVMHKAFNWEARLPAPTQDNPDREVKVSEISLYDDVPIVDGKACHIASMYSK